jgi:hypothetical protein
MPTRFSRFDPALTPILTEAFERAWITVERSGVTAKLDEVPVLREAIATRIIVMAEGGMTNVTDLAMDALSHVTETHFPEAGETLPSSDRPR